jgi:hypothetical protein
MSSAADARQASMDSSQIYREETYTDRRVGTIRCLTPVTAEGTADATRPVLYVGQAQIMTPMGALPISFDLEASTLSAAIAKFGDAAEQAVQQTMRELQDLRREQASGLVIPDAAGGSIPSPSDLLGRGRPRR